MAKKTKLAQFEEILKEERAYGHALGKLEFDLECCAPAEGMAQVAEETAILGNRVYKLTHGKKYVRLLTELHENPEGLDEAHRRMVEMRYRDYAKTKNVSEELNYRLELATGKSYGEWLNAKQQKDFSLYRDAFREIVDVTREVVQTREDKKGTLYDECLSDYEPGMTCEKLDAFFAAIRARVVPLMQRIVAEGKPIRSDFLKRTCPIPQQERFSKYLLELEGLRPTALTLMTTEHPFTTSFGPKDVRVTTHYYEDRFLSNIFTTLHEGGHALFMMYEPNHLHDAYAGGMMSNGMHECVSRFYENLIGRSEAFIRFIAPKLREFCPDVMDGVTERELYEAVNIAQPSLNRCDSDELTYCLHVLIRYEIEKRFINGEITVDDVPEMWNRLYKEILGVDVPDDAEGCLQDVHWTAMFGYFPSYALGNAYGAQILKTMRGEMDVDGLIERGEFGIILDWMKERVFARASLTDPEQWLKEITGQTLDVNVYLDYLEEKYTKLYGLK